MSLTIKKSMRVPGFSLRKSRKVPKQPSRNLNLKYIVNNSREDIIIIPKEKIDILRRDFDWFDIIIDNLENDEYDDAENDQLVPSRNLNLVKVMIM